MGAGSADGSEGGTEHFNATAARDTQDRTAELNGRSSLREAFLDIASPRGIFGKVPNGAGAEEVLENAARGLLEEAERHAISVENIIGNAGEVARIADMTDEEAALQARLAMVTGPGGQELRVE